MPFPTYPTYPAYPTCPAYPTYPAYSHYPTCANLPHLPPTNPAVRLCARGENELIQTLTRAWLEAQTRRLCCFEAGVNTQDDNPKE